MSVTIGHDQVMVRGLLRTRTVPRTDVIGVSVWSTLHWRDPSGRQRRSVILAFFPDLSGLSQQKYSDHARICLDRMTDLLGFVPRRNRKAHRH